MFSLFCFGKRCHQFVIFIIFSPSFPLGFNEAFVYNLKLLLKRLDILDILDERARPGPVRPDKTMTLLDGLLLTDFFSSEIRLGWSVHHGYRLYGQKETYFVP